MWPELCFGTAGGMLSARNGRDARCVYVTALGRSSAKFNRVFRYAAKWLVCFFSKTRSQLEAHCAARRSGVSCDENMTGWARRRIDGAARSTSESAIAAAVPVRSRLDDPDSAAGDCPRRRVGPCLLVDEVLICVQLLYTKFKPAGRRTGGRASARAAGKPTCPARPQSCFPCIMAIRCVRAE